MCHNKRFWSNPSLKVNFAQDTLYFQRQARFLSTSVQRLCYPGPKATTGWWDKIRESFIKPAVGRLQRGSKEAMFKKKRENIFKRNIYIWWQAQKWYKKWKSRDANGKLHFAHFPICPFCHQLGSFPSNTLHATPVGIIMSPLFKVGLWVLSPC